MRHSYKSSILSFILWVYQESQYLYQKDTALIKLTMYSSIYSNDFESGLIWVDKWLMSVRLNFWAHLEKLLCELFKQQELASALLYLG